MPTSVLNTKVKEKDRSPDNCLEYFKKQVELRPHHPAVKMGNTFLTYKILDERTDELANKLKQYGVARDVLVGVLLPRSIEMIISIFAILKAGGAFVPMDPGDSKDRLKHILSDGNFPVLLTSKEILNERDLSLDKVIIDISISRDKKSWISPLKGEVSKNPDLKFPILIHPNSLAYLIYTSGVTGKPKGVLIEHQNLTALVNNFTPRIKSMDRILQSMGTSCDSAIAEIFPTLCNGATLVLWKEDLPTILKKEKINHTCLTPSMAELFDPKECDSLNSIIIAGEKLPEKIVRRFPSRIKVYNGYGPTECCVAVSNTLIRDPKEIHIGGILPHVKTYVVDRNFQLSAQGELLVGGLGVGRGYYNLPELTAKNFIPNPFGAGKVYRTGDIVKKVGQNRLEFIGRLDRQVKINEFRVELDGVENIINGFEGINKSHLIKRNNKLQAYISPKDIKINDLKDYLIDKLPTHAIPENIYAVETFPINASGKVDEDKLPKYSENLNLSGELPQTPFAKIVAKLWRDILYPGSNEIEHPILLKDNFFDLGGTSIDSMNLIKAAQREFHPDIPGELIFENPKLEDFINALEAPPSFKDSKGYRKLDHETPWESIFMDGLRAFPATIYFYASYAIPQILLILFAVDNPFWAITFVLGEIFIHRYWKMPKTQFFKQIKIFFSFYEYKYNSVEFIQDAPLDQDIRTIYAVHPQGLTDDHISPIEDHLIKNKINFKTLYHEVLFKMPVSKTIYSLWGGMPARSKSFRLAQKHNHSLLVTPGDGGEGFNSDTPGIVSLKTNKHFFKNILQTGTSITPIYVHNNHKAFKLFKYFLQQRLNIFNKDRSFVIQPFWGKWYLPIPFKIDLKIAVGKPLEFEKIENPSWEDVEYLFNRYQDHLKSFYKKYAPTDNQNLKIS